MVLQLELMTELWTSRGLADAPHGAAEKRTQTCTHESRPRRPGLSLAWWAPTRCSRSPWSAA